MRNKEKCERDLQKLDQLAELEGFSSVDEMIEQASVDSCVPSICTNPECDYTTEMEPDQSEGWCESCQSNTVASCLVLLLGAV